MARPEDKEARARRLAEALRQNLHRRKAQARRREAAEVADDEQDEPEDG